MENRDFFAMSFLGEVDGSNLTSSEQLKKLGNVNDIEMLSADEYKKKNKVVEKFTKEDGTFDEQGFGEFYNTTLAQYMQLSQLKEIQQLNRTPLVQSHITDAKGIENTLKATDITKQYKIDNPLGISIGVQGLGTITQPDQTIYEIAQQQKVLDVDGNERDFTPEDLGFWKNLFGSDTYVFDTYDKDGVDEKGRTVKKGQVKYTNGVPRYRQLKDGEEAYGKEILSSWDVSTREGTWWNSINFLEGDDKEKNIIGVFAQTASKIAPYFNKYTRALKVGLDLLDTIGMISKVGVGFAAGDKAKDNAYFKTVTNLKNTYDKIGTSTTINSKSNLMTFENLGNLISSSVAQLRGQKTVAQIPGLFRSKMINNPEVAKGLGTAYMAFSQAEELYGAAKGINATQREAGALYIGLASVLIPFYSKTVVGGWVLNNLDDSAKAMSKTITSNVPKFGKALAQQTVKNVPQNNVPAFFNYGKQLGRKLQNFYKNAYNTRNYTDAAILEGTEEALELGIQKGFELGYNEGLEYIYSGLKQLGFEGRDKKQEKFKFNKLPEEFAMSFFGGALGGMVFKAHDKIFDGDNADRSILNYVLNGETETLLRQLEKERRVGLVDKNLSVNIDPETNQPKIYNKNDPNDKRLNDFVADQIKQYIISMEQVLTDQSLPSMSEIVSNQTADFKDLEKALRYNILVDAGLNTTITDDISNAFSEIISLQKEISSISTDDPSLSASRLEKLNEEKLKVQKKLDDIVSGKNSADYYTQALFMLNDSINRAFGDYKSRLDFANKTDIDKVNAEISQLEKVDVSKLSGAEQETHNEKLKNLYKKKSELNQQIESEYANYKATNQKQDFRNAFMQFKANFNKNKYLERLSSSNISELIETHVENFGRGVSLSDVDIDNLLELTQEDIDAFLNDNYSIELDTDDTGKLTVNFAGNELTGDEFLASLTNLTVKDSALKSTITAKFNSDFNDYISKLQKEVIDKMKIDDDLKEEFELFFDSANNLIFEDKQTLENELINYLDLNEVDYSTKDVTDVVNAIHDGTLQESFSDLKRIKDFKNQINNIQKDVPSLLKDIFNDFESFIDAQNNDIKEKGLSYYFAGQELDSQLKELETLRALLLASKDMNPLVNEFNREKLKVITNLKEYSTDEYLTINSYLRKLTGKLSYLKALSDMNQHNLLRNIRIDAAKTIGQQREAIEDMMEKLQITSIDPEEFNTILGFTSDETSPEVIDKAQVELSELETKIYEYAQKNIEGVKNYLKTLRPSQDDIYEQRVLGTELTAPIKYNYLSTIIRSNSNEFNNLLEVAIGDVGKAPIYAQKFILRQAYANIIGGNTEIFDADQKGSLNETITKDFYASLPNSFMLQSRDGAGKTSVMIPLLISLLQNNKNFQNGIVRVTAPFTRQINNIRKDLLGDVEQTSNEDNNVFVDKSVNSVISNLVKSQSSDDTSNYKELLEEVAKVKDDSKKTYKQKEDQIRMLVNNIVGDSIIERASKLNNSGLLIVDEATQLSLSQVIMLDEIIKISNNALIEQGRNNFMRVVFAGDPDQQGYTLEDGTVYNITAAYKEDSVISLISLRSQFSPFSSLNSQVKAMVNTKNRIGEIKYNLKEEAKIKSEYYTENNVGVLKLGELLDSKDALEKAIERGQIDDNENKLLVISNNPVNLPIGNEYYDVVSADEAQGSQANVVLILEQPTGRDATKLEYYNTHLNRALQLVMFINNEGIFEDTNVKAESATQISPLRDEFGNEREEVIKEMRDSELAILNQISKGESEVVVKADEELNLDNMDSDVVDSQDDSPEGKTAVIMGGELVDPVTLDIPPGSTIKTFSFYNSRQDLATMKTLGLNDQEALVTLAEIKNRILGVGQVNKKGLGLDFKNVELKIKATKFNPLVDDAVSGLGFTADKSKQVEEGKAFIRLVAVIGRRSNKEPIEINLSVFPKLDNPTVDNMGKPLNKSIRQALMENEEGQAVVSIIEDLEQRTEIEDIVELSLSDELKKSIIGSQKPVAKGNYFFLQDANDRDKNLLYQEFIDRNPHIKVTPVIFTSTRNIYDDKLNKFLGKPLLLWTYDKKMSESRMIKEFAKGNKSVSGIVVGSNKRDFSDLIDNFRKRFDPKTVDVNDYIPNQIVNSRKDKMLAKHFLSPKSMDDFNSILVEGMTDGPTSVKALAAVLDSDKYGWITSDPTKNISSFYKTKSGGTTYTKAKVFDIMRFLASVKAVQSAEGNYVSYFNDFQALAEDYRKMILSLNPEMQGGIKGHVDEIINFIEKKLKEKNTDLFANISIKGKPIKGGGDSKFAKIDNVQDLYVNIGEIALPNIFLSTGAIAAISEYGTRQEVQKAEEKLVKKEIEKLDPEIQQKLEVENITTNEDIKDINNAITEVNTTPEGDINFKVVVTEFVDNHPNLETVTLSLPEILQEKTNEPFNEENLVVEDDSITYTTDDTLIKVDPGAKNLDAAVQEYDIEPQTQSEYDSYKQELIDLAGDNININNFLNYLENNDVVGLEFTNALSRMAYNLKQDNPNIKLKELPLWQKLKEINKYICKTKK